MQKHTAGLNTTNDSMEKETGDSAIIKLGKNMILFWVNSRGLHLLIKGVIFCTRMRKNLLPTTDTENLLELLYMSVYFYPQLLPKKR